MTGRDIRCDWWLDLHWCWPCRNGRHEWCDPSAWCECPVELDHDEEDP